MTGKAPYVVEVSQRRTYRDMREDLSVIVKKYARNTNQKIEGWAISYFYGGDDREYYHDFVVQKKGPLFIKRNVITISPPYCPEHINVRDIRYMELGQLLYDEVAKYWRFGKPYKIDDYELHERMEQFSDEIQLVFNLAAILGEDEREPTREERISVIRKLERNRHKELEKVCMN